MKTRTTAIATVMLAVALAIAAPVTAQTLPSDATAKPAVAAQPAADDASSASGPQRWIFENRNYFNPLVAEPRAAQITLLALAWSKEFPYQVEPGSRRVWDVSLGKEIPIVGWESARLVNDIRSSGEWGAGLWIPVSFHMVEDFKDDSNPIINTDYRFGAQVKFRRDFDAGRLGLKLQAGHESTHLGDEFTLHASSTHPDFERINVSYEYWEYGVSWEGEITARSIAWKVVHGGTRVIGDGYYSTSLLEPGGRTIPASRRRYEPSAGVEITSTDGEGWHPYLSIDARLRNIYDYHRASPDVPEDRQWSVGGVLGLRNEATKPNERGVPDLILRGYWGVNPHGQFRSQRSHWQIGVGIFVPM
ncbi:MAG: DUF1207 domain-containing protein [Acidobacteria bacterium]|nr:DUF1207 domain-containing protein [Acidobacteriota bacterium]